jgi:hypothetical protein
MIDCQFGSEPTFPGSGVACANGQPGAVEADAKNLRHSVVAIEWARKFLEKPVLLNP